MGVVDSAVAAMEQREFKLGEATVETRNRKSAVASWP